MSDLAALTDFAAAQVGAPVMVVDRSGGVLAYSAARDQIGDLVGDQVEDPAGGPAADWAGDWVRVGSIVARRVPEVVVRTYRAQGVWRAVHASSTPVFVSPVVAGQRARMAVSVRAGAQVLGSLWVVVDAVLGEDAQRAMVVGASRIGEHLLAARAHQDGERRHKVHTWVALLDGGPEAVAAARGVDLAGPVVVWACDPPGPLPAPVWLGPAAEQLGSQRRAGPLPVAVTRLVDALRFDAACAHPSTGVVAIDDVVYVLMPVSGCVSDADGDAVRAARAFLGRLGGQQCARVAVSTVACTAVELPEARREADRALRALRAREVTSDRCAGSAGAAVGRFADLVAEALLVELAELSTVRGYRPSPQVARLIAYDRARGAALVATLRVWLDRLGDVAAAASDMGVHPNTFRYRLKRSFEVGGIDLDSSPFALNLMLELKLAELHRAQDTEPGGARRGP